MATETRTLAAVVAEAKRIQDEYKGKPMPQNVGEQFEALCKEAAELQASEKAREENEAKLAGAERYLREVPNPALPAGAQRAEEQKAQEETQEIAGYISIGEFFTLSDAYRKHVAAGSPAGVLSAPVKIEGLRGRYLPLTREQRKAVGEAMRMERKAVPTIGAGVIEPQRVSEVFRVTERDRLTIRGLVNVSQTNSPSVEWIRLVTSPAAAAMVAESAAKPEAGMEVDTQNTPVRTIAVHMPVTEQQLQDAPQITNLINGELLYDLDRVEELEMVYGDGTGQHFDGILHNTGVLAGRTVTGDTLIDKVRRAMTDVRRAGFEPNGIAMDPLDWEDVLLAKGTDDRYVWVVVPADNGNRLWGLPVVETTAVEAKAGDTTEARSVIVGDFRRGATLWDRQQAQVMVGWINDQFTKNQRTILAEKRAAFAVTAPLAFRKIATQVAVP